MVMKTPIFNPRRSTAILLWTFVSLVSAQAGGVVFSGFPKPPIFPTGVNSNDASTVTLTGSDASSDFTEIRILGAVSGSSTVLGTWTPDSPESDSSALPITLEVSDQHTPGQPAIARVKISFRPFDSFWNDLMTIEATMGPLAGEGVFSTSSFAFVITTQGFRDFPAIIQRQQAANSVPVLSTSVLPRPTLVVPPLDQTSSSTSLSATDIQTVPTTRDGQTTSQIVEETAVILVPPPPASPTAIANPDPSPEEGITKPAENADISGLTPGAKIGIALGVLIGNAFIIGSLAYLCARKGFVISIPLLGPRKKPSATEKGGEYGTKSLPHVYASEMDGVAPAVELEAQRGPFELEARTSFYRRSLAVQQHDDKA
ncbi:unnamed protein product [Parascedosporium putredinis]|uniref:Mid2 domain-containing protein n=1 Tax=Parascedosporium putredinis TaxID=1442378 RepID=A0A9P1H0E6_9PEZI|nr:unnamed protein product [Parascedosporium putredinis]CAI7992590.1 unnamed protein product [Parascedosporium putredinis]